jgi:hypothetical protein
MTGEQLHQRMLLCLSPLSRLITYYQCTFQLAVLVASAVVRTRLIKPIPIPPVSNAPMIASVFLNLVVSMP